MSDDRPSNAHLSVNHAGCSLDRSGGKADCRHRESRFFHVVSTWSAAPLHLFIVMFVCIKIQLCWILFVQ